MTPNKTTILIESYEPDSKVYGPKKGGGRKSYELKKNVGLVRELLSPGSKAGPVKPS